MHFKRVFLEILIVPWIYVWFNKIAQAFKVSWPNATLKDTTSKVLICLENHVILSNNSWPEKLVIFAVLIRCSSTYSLCFINPLVSEFLYIRLRDLRVFNLSRPRHLWSFNWFVTSLQIVCTVAIHAKLCAISLMRKCSNVFSLVLSFSPHRSNCRWKGKDCLHVNRSND